MITRRGFVQDIVGLFAAFGLGHKALAVTVSTDSADVGQAALHDIDQMIRSIGEGAGRFWIYGEKHYLAEPSTIDEQGHKSYRMAVEIKGILSKAHPVIADQPTFTEDELRDIMRTLGRPARLLVNSKTGCWVTLRPTYRATEQNPYDNSNRLAVRWKAEGKVALD